MGLSVGEYVARGRTLFATVTFARADVARLVPSMDDNHDGHLAPAELLRAEPDVVRAVVDRIRVSSGGAPCVAQGERAALVEEDGLSIDARYVCGPGDAPFDVALLVLRDLPPGSKQWVHARLRESNEPRASVSEPTSRLFDASSPPWSLDPEPSSVEPPSSGSSSLRTIWTFFTMGITHILEGWDHLVFLFGLLLVATRARDLFVVVTSFTLAHSTTLALAATGIFTPSARFVEPAIALSIVFVGVENLGCVPKFSRRGARPQKPRLRSSPRSVRIQEHTLVRNDLRGRWIVAFTFGLVHGFGFASILRDLALPRAELPRALVSFNVGVEVGQLAVMALVLPLLILARKTTWFRTRGVTVLSALVVVAGTVWFFARIFEG